MHSNRSMKNYLLHVIIMFSILESQRAVNGYNATLLNSITKLLNSLLRNYDKKFRPNFYEKGSPVVVTVDISVRSMGPISERDMEFSMNCYFRQRWFDERLRFDATDQLEELMLSAKFLKDIWRPDTYIRNGRNSYHHLLTMPNTLVRIKSNGQVYVSQRITIKTRCHMFLKKFPMDTQACLVEIGSLGYMVDDLIFNWKQTPQVDKDVELSQYRIVDTIATEKNVSSFRNEEEKISTLLVYFQLKRQQGYYILQLYTPCTLIVVMSWVSFWLNKEASPARVALGVMTVLTMSTMGLGGRNDLPRVSYSTALDLYIVACFGFVFCALVEYAVINFAHFIHIKKAVKRYREMTAAVPTSTEMDPTAPVADVLICGTMANIGTTLQETSQMLHRRKPTRLTCLQKIRAACCCCFMKNHRQTNDYEYTTAVHRRNMLNKKRAGKMMEDPNTGVDWIDDLSKILFPATYILFNTLYWLAFLYWIPDEINNIPAIKENVEKLNSFASQAATKLASINLAEGLHNNGSGSTAHMLI